MFFITEFFFYFYKKQIIKNNRTVGISLLLNASHHADTKITSSPF